MVGMRILLVSTPVSPIGAGDGGGVETLVALLAPELRRSGHAVGVIAPAGSHLPGGVPVHEIAGASPPSATTGAREGAPIAQSDGVLERMWEEARRLAPQHDIIIALTYDWLSYYLTPFLPIPVLHLVTLPSLIEAVDAEIREQYARRPDHFAFCSRTQASTFPFVDARQARIIPLAVNKDQFAFSGWTEPILVWAARISPEKGLEDAVAAALKTGMPLHVCGKIQDRQYWERIISSTPEGAIVYHGFLLHERLAQVLGKAKAMLATPKWVEAFGLSVIEALACGTPVIAYEMGGPGEIIEHGKSGLLIRPDDVEGMAEGIREIGNLDRRDARRRAEEYSAAHMAENVEQWADSVLQLEGHARARGAGQ